MTEVEFGQPLPSNLDYAVSFGIPTWESAVKYVEKDPYFVSKMKTGYPRYFPQPAIQTLCGHFIKKYGRNSVNCRPFPSLKCARDCLDHVKAKNGSKSKAYLASETFHLRDSSQNDSSQLTFTIAVVFAPDDEIEVVKEYWKLTGECVSSRLAAFINQCLEDVGSESSPYHLKRPEIALLKERGEDAKLQVKKRIADNHTKQLSGKKIAIDPLKDVFLVSSGMSSIFNTRKLLTSWESNKTSETSCYTAGVFGFPFKDTKVIMEKFGECLFFGFGDSRDVKQLKNYLEKGDNRILAIYLETPSNPMLNVPDLQNLRKLADDNEFFIIIDDTIGGLNINVLPYADIVCTSLTKLFSGSSNVMGGSILLNPQSKIYPFARTYFESTEFEELLWLQDAIVLEENSRDYEERTTKTNQNTKKLLDEVLLPLEGEIFKKVYYPSVSSKETLQNYDAIRYPEAGYGSLFSLSFYNEKDAKTFYDNLKVFKGPSNGTNFTLACPYVHLAHHFELDAVSKYGADAGFVRVSVGLEDIKWLARVFEDAIAAVKR
ncbi:LAMI_0C10990g1_1 [Lachancea mirantina]|uniref:LAMI_0C10990g1_1 n=1 Tax=Lachancea mirantina TaxID=1230905 RepID=A0A1G4J6T8_9SACH|nr:LAMI_0C10990g1_1 [Lachancea mirantina]